MIEYILHALLVLLIFCLTLIQLKSSNLGLILVLYHENLNVDVNLIIVELKEETVVEE